MQIILTQDEILEALEAAVRTQIAIAEGQSVSIELKAGRGENGFSATLDIVPAARANLRATTVSAPVTPMSQTAPAAAAVQAPKASPFKAAPKAQSPEPAPEPVAESPETPEEEQNEDPAPEIPNEDSPAPAPADEAPAPAANPRSIFSKIKTA